MLNEVEKDGHQMLKCPGVRAVVHIEYRSLGGIRDTPV